MSALDGLIDELVEAVASLEGEDRLAAIQKVNDALERVHPLPHPVRNVRWVPVDQVSPNDYNPNSVAER